MSELNESLKASICITRFVADSPFEEIVDYLQEEELSYYAGLQVEKRRKSFLLGRLCAKKAIQSYSDIENLKRILIRRGIFQQPIVVATLCSNVQVSITHSNDIGAAIAFSEGCSMGIDIEKISEESEVIESVLTQKERNLIQTLSMNSTAALYLMWTAKEALSKILKTGFTTPPQVFEIEKIHLHSSYASSEYTNFSQFKATSFQAGDYIVSIVHPKRTLIDLKMLNYLISKTQAICSFH
ncbi:4'-phosphopantetheinyl transferase family protein [Saccharibacillus brassicae]|uniref:4'-phosphopantetheinyl transferase superfamily protein n=1 Tax=Saccharibacillus brassicae TaxID=2583377 RepID=A0A4Y6UTX6_SACBS|nr:4'-phosphopantetheinyl transferase superfamily protein [Saccharibacillus brassicae]QDH19811.1 4'-phosphopantetheinyl transferase superfamily protein [Saccharibacillus brassicae]